MRVIPTALSIDLAVSSYHAIGAACVRAHPDGSLTAEVIRVPLSGRPDVEPLARWILEVAGRHHIGCIAIDGPLGWRGPESESVHARLSERAVRAPGKTGLPPDGVKPRTYLGFTSFSIALFERLTAAGWLLPATAAAPTSVRMVTETFPTASWRALGLTPLAAKAKCRASDVQQAMNRLTTACAIRMDGVQTHDDLQAIVGGIAPAWWMAGLADRVAFAGAPPFRAEGSWREGFIILPASRQGQR